jgi:hypothetical protein
MWFTLRVHISFIGNLFTFLFVVHFEGIVYHLTEMIVSTAVALFPRILKNCMNLYWMSTFTNVANWRGKATKCSITIKPGICASSRPKWGIKTPKRISALRSSVRRYGHFTGILASGMVYTRGELGLGFSKTKPNRKTILLFLLGITKII